MGERCKYFSLMARLVDGANGFRCVLTEGHEGSHCTPSMEGWSNEEIEDENLRTDEMITSFMGKVEPERYWFWDELTEEQKPIARKNMADW